MAGHAKTQKRANWTSESMSGALTVIRNGDMGLRAAARSYGVPTTTLKRHLDGQNKFAKDSSKHTGRPTMLPAALEEELVSHIITAESMFLGFTRKTLMTLAYEIAEKNGVSHVFRVYWKDKKQVGKDWLRLFLKHHPEISLRQPEATSLARASGFNKQSVGQFFDLLEIIIDEHGLNATCIYNMDETAVSSIQKKCQKVLAKKGKHQVGVVSSGERGSNTTIVSCTSASWIYVPPFILFKRKRMPAEFGNGAPPGIMVKCNDSGWMDRDMFVAWLQHFLAAVKPTKEKKILLIVDGHRSHKRSLKAVDLARNNGVIMLSLPPHTSHKLQPLDVSFFGPLQTYYCQAQESWLRNNPGRQITAFQVCELFNMAYTKAASMANAVSGFSKCGIWPCNRNIFIDTDFLPASSLNRSPFCQATKY